MRRVIKRQLSVDRSVQRILATGSSASAADARRRMERANVPLNFIEISLRNALKVTQEY
ncbi:hypothetical protein D3C72_1378040 [compost metagenome]